MGKGRIKTSPPVRAAQNAGKVWQKAISNLMPPIKPGQRILSEQEQIERYRGRQDWAKLIKERGAKAVADYIQEMERLIRK